ncbi:MAG: methylated-DNA--[protein]-cysteine S-methyltransferase [Melioribacteraceae bacterium]
MSFKTFYNSPVGLIEICGTENSITSLYFIDEEFNPVVKSNQYIEKCVKQLDEYFKGKNKNFELNLQPEGTDFQKRVWDELLKIPYGETRSYMEITKLLGDPKAIRAVANANGQNKVSIIIPCHRVIGSDGSLTGYGSGLWRKKWLLEHEQKFSNTEKQLKLTL